MIKHRKCPVCGKSILPDQKKVVRKGFVVTHYSCDPKKYGYVEPYKKEVDESDL